jgi:hypothetical protein
MAQFSLRNQQYSVLALYGIEHDPVSTAEFYAAIVQWCDRLGCIPNKSLVHGDGFSGKCISFKHNNNKLIQKGFASVSDFELFTIPDNAKNPMFEYLVDIIYAPDSFGSYSIISINNEIACVIDSLYSPIVKLVIQTLKPVYGIGYLRELGKGPSLYAVGIGQGREIEEYSGAAYEEGVRHSHWGGAGMQKEIYREGVIRDIYPWNLLNNKHLDFPIDGIPFRQWIQGDRNRGSLTALTDECWLWEISEAAISGIRPILWNSGIIFNKQHYL